VPPAARHAPSAPSRVAGRATSAAPRRSAMSEERAVQYEVLDRIARITLDRPERGNGITRRLVEELAECVERADLDPEVHVILLSGNGPGFCGGYALVESAEGRPAEGTGSEAGLAGSPLDPAVMAANHDPA